MTSPRRIVGWRSTRVSRYLVAVLASLGAVGCGWKVPDTLGPGSVRGTIVVMQNQDGEILGSKFLEPGSKISVSIADAGTARLSSKYIAIRTEPKEGKIGSLLAWTNTGAVSFGPPVDGAPVRAVFMSTEHLPEALMDCSFGNFWGPGFEQVARALPGEDVPSDRKMTVLDGDETVFTEVIDDLNTASIDRQGTVLGRLTWDRGNTGARIKVGFGDPPGLAYFFFDFWAEGLYVLVDPRDSRRNQALATLGGVLCGDYCGHNACGQSVVRYLVDPAGTDYRLSRQGISLLRFAANLSTNTGGMY